MIVNKMIRAAMLDSDLYEEVEADTKATPEAIMVVVISSVAGGIGMGDPMVSDQGIGSFILSLLVGSISSLVAWGVWAYLTYVIGTKIFPGPETKATYGELLRTIGFSASPGVIRLLGIITPLQWPIFLISSIWSLVTMVIAVRQALDFTTGRAIGTCLVGWIIQALFLAFLLIILSAAL